MERGGRGVDEVQEVIGGHLGGYWRHGGICSRGNLLRYCQQPGSHVVLDSKVATAAVDSLRQLCQVIIMRFLAEGHESSEVEQF
jgi:hypothetical protein